MLETHSLTHTGRKLVGINRSQPPRHAAADAQSKLHQLTVRLAVPTVNAQQTRARCQTGCASVTTALGHRQLGRRPGNWDDRRIVWVVGRGGLVGTGAPSYKGFRFPVEIISHCVWLYYRFPLSLREVEEMMLARGVTVSHETIRQWTGKFGQADANGLRRRRPRPGDKWHLDEALIEVPEQPGGELSPTNPAARTREETLHLSGAPAAVSLRVQRNITTLSAPSPPAPHRGIPARDDQPLQYLQRRHRADHRSMNHSRGPDRPPQPRTE